MLRFSDKENDVEFLGHAIMFGFKKGETDYKVYINDTGIVVGNTTTGEVAEYDLWTEFELIFPIFAKIIKSKTQEYMQKSLEALTTHQYNGLIKDVNDRMYC